MNPTQTGCLSSGEKPIIKWKSSMTHLFVTGDFKVENVIFDGADMTRDNIQTPIPCMTSRTECCAYDPILETFMALDPMATCTIASSDYQDWNVDAQTYKTTYKSQKQYGMFVFEYIRDHTNAPIPTLTLKDCEINNFFYSKYHTSFIQMSNLAGNLLIENTSFNRFFFPHGLISNAHKSVDRSLFGFSSFSDVTCRSLQNPGVANCHSITIKDSTFDTYNPFKTTNLMITDVHAIEGAVLAVHNIDGPITVHGSDFK